jgi:signal transduction histidine kinase
VPNVGVRLPSRGLAEGDAVTLAYDVPPGEDAFLRGESNVWRTRTRSGEREALVAPLRLRSEEVERDAGGRVLVEARLGVGRTIWAHPAYVGARDALDAFVLQRAAVPLFVVGWFVLASLQQGLALRAARFRRATFGLALTLVTMVLRSLALQFRFSDVWGELPMLARALEVLALPLGGLGWGLFYFWVGFGDERGPLERRWLASALGVTAAVAGSLFVPAWRPLGLNLAYLFLIATLGCVVEVLRRGWHTIARGERVLIVGGAAAVACSSLVDIVLLKQGHAIGIGVAPVGFMIETLCQAAILGRRNARAHELVAELGDELELRNAALTDANARLGEANGVLAAELDERRRLQGELDRATQQLTQAEHMATLGMLMAGIAHDLRNPVHAVRGCAEALEETLDSLARAPEPQRAPLLAEARETVGWIGQSVGAMDALSLAMRNQSRIGSDDEADVVDLAEVVEEALLLCRARTKLCELEVDVPSASVEVDATGLGQLVMNLVSNAADAVSEAREREPSRAAALRVSGRVSGDRIVIAIEDSGLGVPEHVRARILEPFFTTKPRGQGTGLGLAIVQRVVREHGGTLEVGRSEALGGARFTAVLGARGSGAV